MNGSYSLVSVISEDSARLIGLPCLYMNDIIDLETGILKSEDI